MSQFTPMPHSLTLIAGLVDIFVDGAVDIAAESQRKRKFRNRRRLGATLRPGENTPMWNLLWREAQSHIHRYGDQAKLGRILQVPRQRVSAFLTAGREMSDAERAVQLMAWVIAQRQGRPPG
ncbi:MAG TPA: hypothetical protein VIK52_13645 [Opitutaceae bacterium]